MAYTELRSVIFSSRGDPKRSGLESTQTSQTLAGGRHLRYVGSDTRHLEVGFLYD